MNLVIGIGFLGSHSGHSYLTGPLPSIKLCFKVSKASSSFSTASSPVHPAVRRPRERPPHPANRSIKICDADFTGCVKSICRPSYTVESILIQQNSAHWSHHFQSRPNHQLRVSETSTAYRLCELACVCGR